MAGANIHHNYMCRDVIGLMFTHFGHKALNQEEENIRRCKTLLSCPFLSWGQCPKGSLWCIYCSLLEQQFYSGSCLRRETAAFGAPGTLCASQSWFRIGFPQPPGAQSTGMPLFQPPDYVQIRHTCTKTTHSCTVYHTGSQSSKTQVALLCHNVIAHIGGET